MKKLLFTLLGAWCALSGQAIAADKLAAGFSNPPESTKPWVYWYWISDNISREGITRDLEAMKRVGIGEALIGNIYLDDVKKGSVKALTPEWWGMVEHAIREGGRIGVNIGMFNCPGWSQSGGPWIQPTQAMRFLVTSEQRVTGPSVFEGRLAAPAKEFQDVALLAFPAPDTDASLLSHFSPAISGDPAGKSLDKLCDGDRATPCSLPPQKGKSEWTIDLKVKSPFTAQSVSIYPSAKPFSADCELQVAEAGGAFRTVRKFKVDRSNHALGVGPMPRGPVTVSFPAETAAHFRLRLTRVGGEAALAEIEISSAPRLERYVEKQLGKMHPTPLPMWDTYLWPTPPEPTRPEGIVQAEAVRNLTGQLSPDGTLRWEVPAGKWTLLRVGMSPTGTRNAPASPEGEGLEVDKMNRAAAQAHFDTFIGNVLRSMPEKDRKAFKHVVADSYEMGSQNWTDQLEKSFQQRYGYDPRPWLPVLTGRIVNGADASERFLWDLRRLVADQVATEYVGGLRDASRKNGLQLWLENYGHWGFPAEFLQYGGQSDRVGGEFWATGELGSIELRAAASAAHIYGKPIVSAEAFTSTVLFESTPWSLKRRGDWALSEGINHWVLHVYIHQPAEDSLPGVNAWFSTEFNRHNTWFEQGKAWIDYYRRSQFLLQQGHHVADVAYFIGEDTPKMTGTRQPALPAGYNYDYINGEVIRERLKVKQGRFVLPDGMSYRLLVLPPVDTMRPELLKKIRQLTADGGTILGAPPVRSPSLENYPKCDQEVARLAAEVWRGCDGDQVRDKVFHGGRVLRGLDITQAMNLLNVPPDVQDLDRNVLWTHRSTGKEEIYFLSNQEDRPVEIAPVFRVKNRLPEVWDPVAGKVRQLALFETSGHGTRVPLRLNARESLFVCFRESPGRQPSVVSLSRDGRTIASTEARKPAVNSTAEADASGTFTMAAWVLPDAEIALPQESNSGVFMHLARNDVVFPVHGNTFSPEGHSGAGFSAGRNGVAVYEHAGNYFAPVLVHAAPLTNWTHVAVVYEQGRPSLFLNGKRVHQGLRSRFTPHPAINPGQAATSGSFQGQVADLNAYSKELAPEALLAMAANPPARSSLPPVWEISRAQGGRVDLEIAEEGRYTLQFSGAGQQVFAVPAPPAPVSVTGPWQLRFPAGMDVPERLELTALESLVKNANPAIQHFSGTTAYSNTVSLTAQHLATGQRLWLDLGRVEPMAEVVVNGKNLGVFWCPPYRVDISPVAKVGLNTIEVRVTGTWRNRLVGNAKFPKGFQSRVKPQFTPSLTADLKLRGTEPLSPFGLIGPVRIIPTRIVTVE